jgi:hypothetical protein
MIQLLVVALPASIAAFSAILVALIKRSEAKETKRLEMEKEIGKLRNERDKAESVKNEAHDALARQMARCMRAGNNVELLDPLIEAADKATVIWLEKERELHEQMEAKWAEIEPSRIGWTAILPLKHR